MPYQTHKSVTAVLTSRFREMWDGVYPTVYDNLVPTGVSPTNSDIWLEFSIKFGGSLSKRLTIDGDYSVNRHFGLVRVKVHVPVGGYIATLLDIAVLIGRTFSSRYWNVPHLYMFPSDFVRHEKTDTSYVGIVEVPFHFDYRSGDIDPVRIVPSVRTALENANSPLLSLSD